MPQTTVPEEQKRAEDLDDLRNNIWPTENRVVFLEGQSDPDDGLSNLYWWDSSGDPNNSSPPDSVASGISQFGAGGSDAGLWRRTFTPVDQLTTDDITEGSNLYYTDNRARNALSAGGDLTYDSTTGEFSVITYKSSDFDTDFSNKGTDDLTEGSTNRYFSDERAQDAVASALSGGDDITITYDNANDQITVDFAGTNAPSVSNNGTEIVNAPTDINFDSSLEATDDGDGTVTVGFNGELSQSTFSGDGTSVQFQISHGLGQTPSTWIVQSTTDDGSGISHVTADSTNLTVNYDTSPPSGTDNIVLNWLAIRPAGTSPTWKTSDNYKYKV